MIRISAILFFGAASLATARPFDVRHYAVTLEPDLEHKTLIGREAIELIATEAGIERLEFDAGELTIDAVTENRRARHFEKVGKTLRISLDRPTRRGDRHRFAIDYHGAPRDGLEFHPERHELYTVFSTSQWMVAIDAPDQRATFDLTLTLPDGLTAFATGTPKPPAQLADGRRRHRWHLATPMPSYLYGFAAGRYTQRAVRQGDARLRYASSDLDAAQLDKVFADSGDMLAFFADRSGLAYRGNYAQVLVTDTIGQEMAGMSLLSEEYGRGVLDDAQQEGLIAHELAHQWWGNRLTCESWNHFWLNEGFATFMTAAYLQHRFGDALYAKQVERWQARVEKLRAEGKDKPLVFPDWNHPSGDDRAVVYQKGAYVLHLLREELGDTAFWRGMRRYTRDNDGRAVTTADFRRAMERASGRDLGDFFARWIDRADVPGGH